MRLLGLTKTFILLSKMWKAIILTNMMNKSEVWSVYFRPKVQSLQLYTITLPIIYEILHAHIVSKSIRVKDWLLLSFFFLAFVEQISACIARDIVTECTELKRWGLLNCASFSSNNKLFLINYDKYKLTSEGTIFRHKAYIFP